MTLEWWHYLVAVGAYALGVSSNLVASIFQRFLYRRTGIWWLEP